MTTHIIDRSIKVAPDYPLDPSSLGFGKHFAPNMFLAEYKNGKWGESAVVPLKDLSLHPGSIVFHYAQAIFEGLKAYRSTNDRVVLFRPELNARRFNISAERMAMPSFPEEMFVAGAIATVRANRNYIPSEPGSLYLRPTMIGTEAHVGVKSSTEYLCFIIALPSGAYFSGNVNAVDVLVSETASRAAPGGTGYAKAAVNYGASLKTIADAKAKGLSQVLFLDAVEHRYVEELGGMNVMFVSGNRLITPQIHDTILDGITRRSLIAIAPELGLTVEERKVSIDEIVSGVEDGSITEVLACGTAAVIVPIQRLVFSQSGKILKLSNFPVGERLREALTSVQFGCAPDNREWTVVVE